MIHLKILKKPVKNCDYYKFTINNYILQLVFVILSNQHKPRKAKGEYHMLKKESRNQYKMMLRQPVLLVTIILILVMLTLLSYTR